MVGISVASWSKSASSGRSLLSGYTQHGALWFHESHSPCPSQRKRARCSFRMQRSITTKIPAWRAFSAAFS